MSEQQHTEIELIKQDIGYIKDNLGEMNSKLDTVLKNYVRREEVSAWHERVNTEIDKRFQGAHNRLDNTLSIKDFESFKADLREKNKPFRDLFWKMIGYVAQLIVFGGLLSYFLNK